MCVSTIWHEWPNINGNYMGHCDGPGEIICQNDGAASIINSEALACLMTLVKLFAWDITTNVSIRNLSALVVDACRATGCINLSSDATNARIKMGHVLVTNRDQDAFKVCRLLVEYFGGAVVIHGESEVESELC